MEEKRKITRKPSRIYQINDKYRIKSDLYCLILESQNDKVGWVNEGYYSTLENLMKSLYDRGIRENLGDLEATVKLRDELLAKFKELIGIVENE